MDKQPQMPKAVQPQNYLQEEQEELQQELESLRREVQILKEELGSLFDLHTKLTAGICSRGKKIWKTPSEMIAIQMLNRTCGQVKEDIQRLFVELTQARDMIHTLESGGQTVGDTERNNNVPSSEDPSFQP